MRIIIFGLLTLLITEFSVNAQIGNYVDTTYKSKMRDYDSLVVHRWGMGKCFNVDSNFYNGGKRIILTKMSTCNDIVKRYYYYDFMRLYLEYDEGKLLSYGYFNYSKNYGEYFSFSPQAHYPITFYREGTDSLLLGKEVSYTERGFISSEKTQNLRDGSTTLYQYFSETGQLYDVIPRDSLGRLNGTRTKYEQNGKIIAIENYKCGLSEGDSFYYKDGELEYIRKFKSGVLIKEIKMITD